MVFELSWFNIFGSCSLVQPNRLFEPFKQRFSIPNYSEKLFKFNNSALFAENKDKSGGSFDEMFWKINSVSFQHFFQELLKQLLRLLRCSQSDQQIRFVDSIQTRKRKFLNLTRTEMLSFFCYVVTHFSMIICNMIDR